MNSREFFTIALVIIGVVLLVLFGIQGNRDKAMEEQALAGGQADASETETSVEATHTATVTTTGGSFTLELYGNAVPKTVQNFVDLAEDGFYEGIRFHRIIDGFMIQGGDPLTKDPEMSDMWGMGGPGYQFDDEFVLPDLSNVTGTISMANSGPNTNGSQFFINVADNVFLDGRHAVFGRVIDGYDVVEKLSQVETLPGDRPVEDVIINAVTIQKK